MKRRVLLSLLASTSASFAFARGGLSAVHAATSPHRHVLVLLQLRGGNDGLNTIVPIQDPLYAAARPNLALKNHPQLTSSYAIHPALAPLLPLWQRKRLGFALGVGWSRPSRSHFKASDQWDTANLSGEGPGWLAAAFDRQHSAGPLVALDPAGCAAMEGGQVLALQLSAAQFFTQNGLILQTERAGDNPVLRQMLELELAGQREVERLRHQIRPLPVDVKVPKGVLGQQVALALRLIDSGACPPVLQLAQGGYDTHANQLVRHNRLLGDLSDALLAFDAGLKIMANRPSVTLLAVSEFGRRLRENGSRGTDHGSASIAFFYGDQIPHPFLGTYPSLSQLDDRGDLIPTISPLELYRQVLGQMWKA
jgi:uncharacterized protein (DUF1501 family)